MKTALERREAGEDLKGPMVRLYTTRNRICGMGDISEVYISGGNVRFHCDIEIVKCLKPLFLNIYVDDSYEIGTIEEWVSLRNEFFVGGAELFRVGFISSELYRRIAEALDKSPVEVYQEPVRKIQVRKKDGCN